MKYMMLIKHTEDYRGKPIPQGLIDAMDGFIGEYAKQGKFLDGAGLKSSHKGKRIQLHGGRLRVVDGPFTETKELIGGYAIADLESDAEALDMATKVHGAAPHALAGVRGGVRAAPVRDRSAGLRVASRLSFALAKEKATAFATERTENTENCFTAVLCVLCGSSSCSWECAPQVCSATVSRWSTSFRSGRRSSTGSTGSSPSASMRSTALRIV